jgi:3-oxoacyl-[acyl-carrier protein] reductase
MDADFKGTFTPLKLDVTDRDSIKDAFSLLKEKELLPDILVNNAGITADQLFLRMKDDDWDNVLNINLTGTFNITKMFIKQMVKNRSGKIINISSVSGLMGNAGQVNYSSSKAALSGFTKSLAKEVGSRNITVNSIAPGFIDTDMTEYLDEKAKLDLESQIPLKRMGNASDISELVYFLASDEASYITGQTISVDGGLFMH